MSEMKTVCIGWPTILKLQQEGMVSFSQIGVGLVASDSLMNTPNPWELLERAETWLDLIKSDGVIVLLNNIRRARRIVSSDHIT